MLWHRDECEIPRHFCLSVVANVVPDWVYSLALRHLLCGASVGSEVGIENTICAMTGYQIAWRLFEMNARGLHF